MSAFWILLFSVVVISIFVALAKKRASGVDLGSFTTGVLEAADAGERAYRAQVDLISSDRGRQADTSLQGIALARMLCASFPAAAYGIVDAGNGLLPSIKKIAPFAGKEVFNLASGAALKPLGITSSHPDYPKIKEDANEVAREYIAFFSDHFSADPIKGLAAAEIYLGRHWERALELSVGHTERNVHTTQFCTSGLHLFITWFQALGK